MQPVTYFAVDYAPGKYFNCEKQHCTLSDTSCAAQFKRQKTNCSGSVCTGCEVGALHAGEVIVLGWPAKMCCRCGGTDKRIISKRVCVSCYNRERELKLGKNAKGKAPIHAKPMKSIEVYVTGKGWAKVDSTNSGEAYGLMFRKDPYAHLHTAANGILLPASLSDEDMKFIGMVLSAPAFRPSAPVLQQQAVLFQ